LKTVKKIEAGSDVDSRCLKCKDVTNHTVIAMVDGKIAKVVCNVCGSRHKHRPATPGKAAGAGRKTSRPSGPGARQAKAEAHFREMLAGRDRSDALPYSMEAVFRERDLIAHPTFGLGVVTAAILPDKIEVLFEQESKLLMCGRLPPAR